MVSGFFEEHRQQIAPVEDQGLGLVDGEGVGRARGAVENGDLADDIALAEEVQHDLARIVGDVGDLRPAREDDHQAVAVVATGR